VGETKGDIMGLASINFDNLFGFLGDMGRVAKDLREAITGKTITDPAEMQELANKAAEIEIKAAEVSHGLVFAQTEINKKEAESKSKFIAGWRPACGWLCVLGLAWQVFIWPLWVWISALIKIPQPPNIETAVLVTLLMGMLGLGTLRTFEKKQGTQNIH
jgi:hypothetical protein